MLLWNEETQAESGFKDVLAEEFSDQNINYTVFNLFKDLDRLDEFIADNDEEKFDLVYTYGSRITSAVAEIYTETPIVFDIVFDPIGYKIIESWDKKQPNLTGASNSIPLDLQIKKIQQVFGKGNLGLIYNPSNQKSFHLKEEMERYLENEGFRLIPFKFNKKYRNLRSYLKKIKGQVKCIYLPSEWIMSKQIKRILSYVNRRKIPTCVTSKTYLKQGALLCIAVDHYDVGRIAGDLAVQILKGTKPIDLAVKRPSESDVKLYINSRTSKRLRLQFPKELELNFIK
jgi:putative ABC transport system substrate-binding protein